MALNSGSNIVILIIQIFGLVSECHSPFGIYCSSIYTSEFAQYFKIVFGESISTFFRLVSNFSYVAFAINRLSLVGTSGKFVKFFSDLSVKIFILFVVLISAGLCTVKGFRYRINDHQLDEKFPTIFYRQPFDVEYIDDTKLAYSLLFTFDALCDFINYVLFIVVNLVFDVTLFVRMRATLRQKLARFSNSDEKKQAEAREAIERVIRLVLLNAALNLVFKLPVSIVSLNDLRLLVVARFTDLTRFNERRAFEFPYSMRELCHIDDVCLVYLDFSNMMFFLAISSGFFFYKAFDSKFKEAFNTFKSNMNNNKKSSKK